jgi:hypothetical protein
MNFQTFSYLTASQLALVAFILSVFYASSISRLGSEFIKPMMAALMQDARSAQ